VVRWFVDGKACGGVDGSEDPQSTIKSESTSNLLFLLKNRLILVIDLISYSSSYPSPSHHTIEIKSTP